MLMRKAALVGTLACALTATAALAEPKTNMLHQWSEGSDAAAIAKLGEMFTAAGGQWEQTSIAGHTANTLAKLRADVVAGNAPPAVQLKGPEIAEWNATGMTANLDDLANKEGWDKVVAPELLPVMKPTGDWVAAPMNIHRINWIWGSTKAMEQAGNQDAAEDLGRIQRRLRQGGRRPPHLSRPFQSGLDRRDNVRSRRLRPGYRSLPQGFRPRRHRSDALPRNGQCVQADAPHGVEIHGPGHRRAGLQHRHQHDRQGASRLYDHGRLADRHFHCRRT